MIEDAAAPGVPPIAVLYSDVQQIGQFRPHLKNQYHYEVLGGLHTVTAKQQLLEEVPGGHNLKSSAKLVHAVPWVMLFSDQLQYKEALANVYCGLTDVECLHLASRHNINGHLNHEMTYGDYVSTYVEV